MATKTKTRPKKRPPAVPNGVPEPTAEEIMTPEQTAVFLKVSVAAVRSEAEAGRMPGRKVSDQWRFSRDAILSWLGTPERPTLADWFRTHPPRPWTSEVEREVEAEIAALSAYRRSADTTIDDTGRRRAV